MALQSSGQIKMSEINTELGRTSTAEISLDSAESGTYATINTASASYPNDARPAAISEWYSYDHSASSYTNEYYWDMSGSTSELRWSDSGGNIENGANTTISISFWFRIDLSTKDNLLFWDLYPNGASTNANRMFFNYSASLNRFVARYRSSSVNFDRQWALHDNSSATGVSNSSTGLSTSQRGNVNSDNFCHLVVTYDGNQSTGRNAFKCYWNGSELTTEAVSTSGTRTNFTMDRMVFGNDYNGGTGDNTAYDEMRIYGKVLSSSEISDIYNSGSPVNSTEDSVTTSLIFEDEAEATTPVDSTGIWSRVSSSGTRTAY